MPTDYTKKLVSALLRYYRQEFIDLFEWFPDEETDTTYSFHFIDHRGVDKRLTYHKDTKALSLI